MSCGEVGVVIRLNNTANHGVKQDYHFVVSSFVRCINGTGERAYKMERGVVYQFYIDQALFVRFAIFRGDRSED